MKVVRWTAYGSPDVLQFGEAPKPTPKDDELLIRVRAATVTMGDCELRTLNFPLMFRLPLQIYIGLRRPQRVTILGQELAGDVEAVGKRVTKFKVGDPIFAATLFRFGAYAEYACLPESYPIAHKPAHLTYAEAATIPTGGLNALHFIKKARLQAGERLLINGAGGSIGTYALQIAKRIGAEVTAVDSAPKLALLRASGADHVIDYQQHDFTRNNATYDVIIDVVGKSPFARSIQSLRPHGRYVLGNLSLSRMLRGIWITQRTDKKVIVETADYQLADLAELHALIETGQIKALLDRSYPLAQTAEAHGYVEQGHKVGNVAILVD